MSVQEFEDSLPPEQVLKFRSLMGTSLFLSLAACGKLASQLTLLPSQRMYHNKELPLLVNNPLLETWKSVERRLVPLNLVVRL